MPLSRPSSQMTHYTSTENRVTMSRPSSQMTRYTAMSPMPTSRIMSPSPPPYSRPSSVVSKYSRGVPSVKLTKGNPMKCNVCLKKLEYQWILPGLHNFCAHCLEEYILRHSRGKHCHCPICRAGIRLPKEHKRPKKIARYPLGTELVICDVCEDNPAFYKCSECNEFFCDKCNTLHLRMKMGRDHHVNILPSIRAVNEKLKVKVYCDQHEHEEVKFHCKRCDVCICRDCKVIEHEGHLTTSIREIADERKLRVSTAVTTAKGHLARMKAESIEIKNRKTALEEETEQTTHEIKQHALRIKDIVDEHSDHLVQTVRLQHDESISKLNDCLEAVTKKTESIKGLLDTASVQMDSSSDVAFINQSHNMIESLRAADIPSFTDKLWRKRHTFVKGAIDELAIQKVVGELKFAAEGLFVPLPAVELQLVSTFDTDQNFRSTTAITTQNDGTAWVCNGYKNRIQRFDNKGRIVQIETTDFDIDDMTTLVDGTVLLTEYNGLAIRKLEKSQFQSYFAKSDLYLRGITTSRDGSNVIVVGNDVPVTKLKQIKHAKVLIFSTTGRKIREIRINRGIGLFRICHTVNGDFVISTGVSAKYLVIDADGTPKYTYTASGSADGVACDPHGLTILSDLKDDTLHLLDSKGRPLPFTYSLNKPNAVAVDNRGLIWVGDLNKIRIMKYV